ncbi:MAG: hypothetical protein HYT87_02275 [Nitrospirae bacterium]|nr:hypothetical protein [Nitrospirota bacterium]
MKLITHHSSLITLAALILAASCGRTDPFAGFPTPLPTIKDKNVSDLTADIGQRRIAIDFFNGYPYIAYYDQSNRNLVYAYVDEKGEKWTSEIVDGESPQQFDAGDYPSLVVDSQGRPHIAYFDGTNLDIRYATRDPGQPWSIRSDLDTAGSVGQWARIAIEEDDKKLRRVHIAYLDSDVQAVKYVQPGGTAPELVEQGRPIVQGQSGTSGEVQYINIAAHNGVVYLAYWDGKGGLPRLAVKDVANGTPVADPLLCNPENGGTVSETGWCISFIDTGAARNQEDDDPENDIPAAPAGTRGLGRHLAMKLDLLNPKKIHVVYRDDFNSQLRYALYDGEVGWTYEIVDGKKSPVGAGADLSLVQRTGKSGTSVIPIAAYSDETLGSLKVAVRSVDDGKVKWQDFLVDSPGSTGTSPVMDVAMAEKEIYMGLAFVRNLGANRGAVKFEFFRVP